MTWALRMAALIGAGSYGVHQLRFALSPESARPPQGHGYLAPLGAVLVGVLLLALAAALRRIARGAVDGTPRLRRLWLGAAASFAAVYSVQESIERVVTHDTAHGVFAHGGWVVLPLALAFGLMVALVMRGAAVAGEVAAEARRAPPVAFPFAELDALIPERTPRRARPTAPHEAARGPPLASV